MYHPERLSAFGDLPIHVRDGAVIIAQGDSLTLGTHGQKAAGTPWVEIMRRQLQDRVTIENSGVGGHRAFEGLLEMPDRAHADLAIVMYGSNDAAVRGKLGRFPPVGEDAYAKALRAIVNRYQAAGTQVLVLAPPPVGSAAMDRRLAPYRARARAVAVEEGALFADPAGAFLADGLVPLQYDGLHLNGDGNRALGQWMAALVTVAPSGASPELVQ